MTVQFDVPFNGDPALVNFIIANKQRIRMVYGRAEDGYPQGRNTRTRKPITLTDITQAQERLASEGILFNYILNGNCHGNREFQREYRDNFIKFVRELHDKRVSLVTLGNPFLIEVVRQEVPDVKIAASVLLEVDNLTRLKQVARMGVDYVCLSKTLLKNFNGLRKISTNTPQGVELMLLANDPCLNQCAYTTYHNNILSHFTGEGGEYVNYCRMHCTQDFASDPRKVISASFIRPEDTGIYESIGFSLFKLCDRKQTTPWVKRAISAYLTDRFDGNLSDIMAPWSSPDEGYPPTRRLSEEEVAEHEFVELREQFRFSPRIDNRQLDGYLDFWLKNKTGGCANAECDACNYCATVAERTYTIPDEQQSALRENLELALRKARK